MNPDELSALLEAWGYPAILALLLLTGVGSPIPEDFLLLSAGYLTFAGVLDWPQVLAVGWCGVVGSDLMLYSAGRQLAWHSAGWPDGHFLSPRRLRRATQWFDRYGHVLVLFARLAPGTRAVVFITAGVRAVPARSFLFYDATGAALWVPAMVAVGYVLGHRLGTLADVAVWLNRGGPMVLAVAGLVLLVWLLAGREQSKL